MKLHHLSLAILSVLLCMASGLALAQDVPPEPRVTRPPLVECTEGQDIPCTEIIDEVSDIVGMWRGYTGGAKAMNFTVFNENGAVGITADAKAEPTFVSSITFVDQLAYIAANPGSNVAAECVTPGIYIMRLIRIGTHPVALTYRPLVKDNCLERATDLSEPMLAYSKTAETLPELKAEVDPLAQPLVPCPTETVDESLAYPCDVVAAQPTDLAGIWTQYLVPPLTGSAFVRFTQDSSWLLSDTPENTAAASTSFAVGTVEFDQARTIIHEPDDTPDCLTGSYYLHVLQWGHQPVALSYSAIKDDCAVRRSAWADPMIWIKGV